jgi:multidrug efflux pump
VLVSGMIIGTLFTLFVLPAIYIVIAKDHQSSKTDPRPRS